MHYKTVFLRGGTTDFELEARMKDRAIYCLTFYMFQILSDPTCLCAAVESHNITKLHFMEQDLLQGLSNYINIMKENLVEYEDILSQSKQDILKQLEYGRRDYLGNPISVFRLVKRFSEGWGKLAKFIREDDPTFDFLAIIRKHSSSFPATVDDAESFLIGIKETS